MSRLFGRVVYVDVDSPTAAGKRIQGLRIGFRANHRGSRALSTASVDIYNPNQTTVGLFRDRNAVVRLWAGYGSSVRQLFEGNPIRDGVDLTQTAGGDRILNVELADGGTGFTDAFISESFTSQTSWSEVINIILRETGWARGEIAIPVGYTLPGGGVFMTRASELLDRAAALVPPVGGTWFVRDGALYIVPLRVATGESELLISSTKGNLKGTPVPTEKGVHVTALIDATMRAGRSFRVESRYVKGRFVANDVQFNGDSGFAVPFDMTITGQAA